MSAKLSSQHTSARRVASNNLNASQHNGDPNSGEYIINDFGSGGSAQRLSRSLNSAGTSTGIGQQQPITTDEKLIHDTWGRRSSFRPNGVSGSGGGVLNRRRISVRDQRVPPQGPRPQEPSRRRYCFSSFASYFSCSVSIYSRNLFLGIFPVRSFPLWIIQPVPASPSKKTVRFSAIKPAWMNHSLPNESLLSHHQKVILNSIPKPLLRSISMIFTIA